MALSSEQNRPPFLLKQCPRIIPLTFIWVGFLLKEITMAPSNAREVALHYILETIKLEMDYKWIKYLEMVYLMDFASTVRSVGQYDRFSTVQKRASGLIEHLNHSNGKLPSIQPRKWETAIKKLNLQLLVDSTRYHGFHGFKAKCYNAIITTIYKTDIVSSVEIQKFKTICSIYTYLTSTYNCLLILEDPSGFWLMQRYYCFKIER